MEGGCKIFGNGTSNLLFVSHPPKQFRYCFYHLIFNFLIYAAVSTAFLMHSCFLCSHVDDMGIKDLA